MSRTYFGFALADSMFRGNRVLVRRVELTQDELAAIVANGVVSCVNKSHTATIEALRGKFGIEVEIPETPPKVSVEVGDRLVVMSHNLPRLTDRREYTSEEVALATWTFQMWTRVE